MDKLLESIACSGTECLCWIMVFMNILAVFYLVFCSFWRVTRLVKVCGWAWAAVLLCTSVGILFFHTCIYTLLTTIFIAMMLMAIMAIVLPSGEGNMGAETGRATVVKAFGSYVISETTQGRYAFSIYDTSRKLLVNSYYSYETLQKAKSEISLCRENGEIAGVEDRTGRWIKEEFHPKFVLCNQNGKYFFSLLINDEHPMLRSKDFLQLKECLALLERVRCAVHSTDVYYSVDKISDDGYVHDGELQGTTVVANEEQVALESPVVEETECELPVIAEEISAADNASQEVAIRYKRSFLARYIQASEHIQRYYTDIKNELLSYKGVKARLSWSRESFKKGNRPLVRIDVKKKTLYMYLALDKEVLDGTKYNYTDVSTKAYGKDYPVLFKVGGDRKKKYAIELIHMLAEQQMGLMKFERGQEDYRMPYENDDVLIERGLIKVLVPKNAVLDESTSTVKANIGALFSASQAGEPV